MKLSLRTSSAFSPMRRTPKPAHVPPRSRPWARARAPDSLRRAAGKRRRPPCGGPSEQALTHSEAGLGLVLRAAFRGARGIEDSLEGRERLGQGVAIEECGCFDQRGAPEALSPQREAVGRPGLIFSLAAAPPCRRDRRSRPGMRASARGRSPSRKRASAFWSWRAQPCRSPSDRRILAERASTTFAASGNFRAEIRFGEREVRVSRGAKVVSRRRRVGFAKPREEGRRAQEPVLRELCFPLLQMTETLEPHRLERAAFPRRTRTGRLRIPIASLSRDCRSRPPAGKPSVLEQRPRAVDGEHRQLLFVRRVSRPESVQALAVSGDTTLRRGSS